MTIINIRHHNSDPGCIGGRDAFFLAGLTEIISSDPLFS